MSDRLTFVGGWTVFKGPTSKWADANYSWPFGRLEIDREAVVLSVRGPLGPVLGAASRVSRLSIPVVIPLSMITRVELKRSLFGLLGLVRFRCDDPRLDGASFVTFRGGFARLVGQIRQLGIPISD
jgi:hypothetical protein